VSGILFIGPALYFYVQSLTSPDFRFKPPHLMHFTPGVFFMLIYSLVFFDVVSPGNQAAHSSLVSFLAAVSSVENLLAITLSFYYIFLSIRLMQKHERWIYQHFSATSTKSLNWLKNLIISLSLVWIVWLFAVVINFFTGDFILTYLSSYPFQIATAIIIFWVGYVGFIHGEVFSMEISLERRMESMRSVSKKAPETNHETRTALIRAMENDRLFMIPDLTLAMLGQHLNISPKNISQILNHELNKNFHDFINEYRVEEVKRRLLNPEFDHLTILAIALDSGFNSKSSFNRIFIKATGMAPKEFKGNRSQEPGARSKE
jgi:AraC-like DNA-binding protein